MAVLKMEFARDELDAVCNRIKQVDLALSRLCGRVP
jgi:hypothetical protein